MKKNEGKKGEQYLSLIISLYFLYALLCGPYSILYQTQLIKQEEKIENTLRAAREKQEEVDKEYRTACCKEKFQEKMLRTLYGYAYSYEYRIFIRCSSQAAVQDI